MRNSSPEPQRYSPERAYRPLVSPPSVEDKDACAIYASVRRTRRRATSRSRSRSPSLQKMLHRAGNVDGEGDGCGLLVDIPRKIWAEEVRSGGHDPSLALDDAFAVAHVFVERSQDLEKVRTTPASCSAAAASASSPSGSARSTRPRSARPRARRSRTSGRSRGLVPDAADARPRPLRPADRARGEARRPRRLVLGRRPASTR